jgi:hypothetical protein
VSATATEPDRITLTPSEARMAILVGTERRLTALMNGGRDRPGIKPAQVWGIDIEGACAEMAFAKRMGWYWDGSVGVFHDEADVRHVNVRSTREHHHDLTIRPADRDGIYVLVTGTFPRYWVHGWCTWPGAPSHEARPDPERAPCEQVRQADLRDLAELETGGIPW